ncbi:MAG: hypothetical protein WC934_02965 [Acidithiobacillus sp.]|jgi:uncharacterized protein YaaN involved in tellurite resistance|uniref:hypothetical protein n=1 Tax=Acidithiobacillus sp. TaxID=1872118 RepID=UPI00355E14D3
MSKKEIENCLEKVQKSVDSSTINTVGDVKNSLFKCLALIKEQKNLFTPQELHNLQNKMNIMYSDNVKKIESIHGEKGQAYGLIDTERKSANAKRYKSLKKNK